MGQGGDGTTLGIAANRQFNTWYCSLDPDLRRLGRDAHILDA